MILVGFKFELFLHGGDTLKCHFPEKKKKVVVENCRPNACRGETRQPGVAARGRRGQHTTRRNQQRTTSGLCILACTFGNGQIALFEGILKCPALYSKKSDGWPKCQSQDFSKPFFPK